MTEGKRAMVLVAHGSRLPEANEEIVRFASQLRNQSTGKFEIVEHGFLEMAVPDIATAIDTCIGQGATALWVMPYFLAKGRHVREDVPAVIEQARARHPDVIVHLCQHLGAQEGLAGLLLSQVISQGESQC